MPAWTAVRSVAGVAPALGAFVMMVAVFATALLALLARLLNLYVIAPCAINFVSVILQCGLGECHTFGYKLL